MSSPLEQFKFIFFLSKASQIIQNIRLYDTQCDVSCTFSCDRLEWHTILVERTNDRARGGYT